MVHITAILLISMLIITLSAIVPHWKHNWARIGVVLTVAGFALVLGWWGAS